MVRSRYAKSLRKECDVIPIVPRLDSMLGYLREHAKNFPDREASVEGDERLSYRALVEQVDLVANCLLTKGIGAGHVVAYIGAPGSQYFISLLAAFQTKATWVGLNPKYRSDELAYVIGHSRPCLIMVASTADERTRTELTLAIEKSSSQTEMIFASLGAAGLVSSLGHASRLDCLAHPSQSDLVALDASVLVYTSGSTGKPKGACLTQSNLVENAWWLARRLDFERGRFLINLPVNHAGCISDTTLVALINGDTLVFMSAFDPIEAARLVRDERITTLGQVPTQYQLMHAQGVLTIDFLKSVRHLGWGGSAMPEGLILHLAGFVPDLFNSYGLTESSGTVTVTAKGASLDQLAHSVGVPVYPGVVRIVDREGTPVAQGISGEVQISGKHVFPGYLRNESATSSALSPDGWLRTGDTGVWAADGSLKLVGRMTEMYKSGGYNIYPREIEAVLESYPGVAMAAVIGVPDPLWGETGYAFILPLNDALDGADLLALCREKLAAYKVPKRIDIRAELPLLPIGKVDRRQLVGLIKT